MSNIPKYSKQSFTAIADEDFLRCYYLIDQSDNNELLAFISNHPELINDLSIGTSLMHYAAIYGDQHIINDLYNLGASIHNLDEQGLTPLEVANLHVNHTNISNLATLYGLTMYEEIKADNKGQLFLNNLPAIYLPAAYNDSYESDYLDIYISLAENEVYY